jgi:hypothetical protein
VSLSTSFVKIFWPNRGIAHFMKWNEFFCEYPSDINVCFTTLVYVDYLFFFF